EVCRSQLHIGSSRCAVVRYRYDSLITIRDFGELRRGHELDGSWVRDIEEAVGVAVPGWYGSAPACTGAAIGVWSDGALQEQCRGIGCVVTRGREHVAYDRQRDIGIRFEDSRKFLVTVDRRAHTVDVLIQLEHHLSG